MRQTAFPLTAYFLHWTPLLLLFALQGRVVDIPFAVNMQYCPVRALKDWILCARIEKEAVFLQVHKGGNVIRERLGDRSVALMLKRRCKPFGFADDIAGHSLRAGHVTSAIKNGTPETWITRQTGAHQH